jgi:hypothetical protein
MAGKVGAPYGNRNAAGKHRVTGMTISAAYRLGRMRYKKGKSSAMPTVILTRLSGRKVGDPFNSKIMSSYSKGWNQANLKSR